MTTSVPLDASLEVLQRLENVARDRILIFGSLPPQGRDIDLLVQASDERACATELSAAGFDRAANQWVLFSGCSARVVELVQATDWGLPPAESAALFSEAAPLNGFVKVVEPSPHHSLLILARKLARQRGPLAPKHRSRIDRALATDGSAWDLAASRAGRWDADAALARLRMLHEGSAPQRRRFARRPRRSRVIALSGIDGAGKSSQATFLQETLDRLGYDAVVEWSPSHAISLKALATPIRRLLGYGRQSELPDRVNPDLRPSAYPAVVVHTWVTLAAFATALSLWRAIGSHLGRERVIICDRHALDFAVFFSYRHGGERRLRFQNWLLRRLAPRPVGAYLLDVAPDTALTRKQDQYLARELHRQAELYRSLAESFGVRTLDGEREVGSVCQEIASDVWRRLQSRGSAD
jgi:thymidylate kinase